MYVPRNVALTYRYISSPTGSYAQLNKWKNVVKAIDIYVTPPITKVDTSQKITSVITKQQNYSLKAFLANSFWSRDDSWDGAPGKYERTEGKMFCGIAMVNVPSTDDETYCKKIADTSTFYKIASLDLENPDDFPLVETELKIDNEACLSGTWRKGLGIVGRQRTEQKKNAQRWVKEHYGLKVNEDNADAICIGAYASGIRCSKQEKIQSFDWAD